MCSSDLKRGRKIREGKSNQIQPAGLPAVWIDDAGKRPDFLRRCGLGVDDFGIASAAVARVVVLELQTVDLGCNLRQQVIR